MNTLTGIAASPGIGIGPVHIVDPEEIEVADRPISKAEVASEQERFRAAIEAVPGVISASPSVYFSLLGGGGPSWLSLTPAAPQESSTFAMSAHTGADYVATIGSAMIEGRDLSDRDIAGSPRVP